MPSRTGTNQRDPYAYKGKPGMVSRLRRFSVELSGWLSDTYMVGKPRQLRPKPT